MTSSRDQAPERPASRAPGKREQQKEARRKAILEAGFEAFTAQGFTATRLDDVAERAGIGKGTIYLYFNSKEALFEEVVRENLFPGRDAAEQKVAEFDGSATEMLAMHLKSFYAALSHEKVPPLIAMVMGEGGRFPELSRFFFQEMVSRNQKIMRRIVEKGIADGEFRETALVDYTQILVAPILTGAIWKVQFDRISPIDLERFAEAHIDLVLNGLRHH